MSGELQGADKIGHVVINHQSEVVEIEFSDGKHYLNSALVSHLGGPAEVRKYTVEARQMTHAEFIRRFWTVVEKDAVNKAVNTMLGSHFAGRGIF